jgi:endo-1,4-beta-mannosidase
MGDRSYVGDPPQEEQGLFGVFDADASTLAVVREHAKAVAALCALSRERVSPDQKVDVTGVMIHASDSTEREPNRAGGSPWTIPMSADAA